VSSIRYSHTRIARVISVIVLGARPAACLILDVLSTPFTTGTFTYPAKLEAETRAAAIWVQVLSLFEPKVNCVTLSILFKPTSSISDNGGALRIGVPSVAPIVDQILAGLDRSDTFVAYITDVGTAPDRRRGRRPARRAHPQSPENG
jgi:hypothetical protein